MGGPGCSVQIPFFFLTYERTQKINIILLFSSRDLVVGSEDTVPAIETVESEKCKNQERQHDPLSKGYHS